MTHIVVSEHTHSSHKTNVRNSIVDENTQIDQLRKDKTILVSQIDLLKESLRSLQKDITDKRSVLEDMFVSKNTELDNLVVLIQEERKKLTNIRNEVESLNVLKKQFETEIKELDLKKLEYQDVSESVQINKEKLYNITQSISDNTNKLKSLLNTIIQKQSEIDIINSEITDKNKILSKLKDDIVEKANALDMVNKIINNRARQNTIKSIKDLINESHGKNI